MPKISFLVHDVTVAWYCPKKDQGMRWAAGNGKHFLCNNGMSNKADSDSGILKQDDGNMVVVVSWKACTTVNLFGLYNNPPVGLVVVLATSKVCN
jgi:hypothetical protein